jgi:hypothetical protein
MKPRTHANAFNYCIYESIKFKSIRFYSFLKSIDQIYSINDLYLIAMNLHMNYGIVKKKFPGFRL